MMAYTRRLLRTSHSSRTLLGRPSSSSSSLGLHLFQLGPHSQRERRLGARVRLRSRASASCFPCGGPRAQQPCAYAMPVRKGGSSTSVFPFGMALSRLPSSFSKSAASCKPTPTCLPNARGELRCETVDGALPSGRMSRFPRAALGGWGSSSGQAWLGFDLLNNGRGAQEIRRASTSSP